MERSVYRIIDANFNRAREAIRVMEEFCRFSLNCLPLTERAKQFRHELSKTIGRLDAARLVAARDTTGDIGAGLAVEGQLKRGNLKDCLTAGCKRLTESLRALSETIQIFDPSTAQELEKMRYAAYTLEKEILLFADARTKFDRVGLYVIISSTLPVEVLRLTNGCLAGGADCIQLRSKGLEDNQLYALAVEFVKLCKDGGALSIINDRTDIAVAADADGVHLGQSDLPVEQARRLQMKPLVIGKSSHSIKELEAACQERPAYVSLGPVFPSGTKPDVQPVGLDYVHKGIELLAETGISHVAIGGINLENIEQVLKAGAKAIAVCSAVSGSVDPSGTCRALREKISSFSSK